MDTETEFSGRRTFPRKGRSSSATRQDQLLRTPEFNPNASSSNVSHSKGCSDTNSIPSRTSSEHHGDIMNNKNRMTRSEQVDLQHFYNSFTQVPLDDPVLQEFECTLRTHDLAPGRLFITTSFVCFEPTTPDTSMATVEIKVESIKSIDLVRPGRWKPRMIQITLKNDAKYTFTTFSPSTASRDEAYQRLMETWQPHRTLTIAANSSSSTPTLASLLTPITTKSKSITECDNSDTISNHNNKSNESLATNAPTTSASIGPFKLFQRKRAPTVATLDQREPQRDRPIDLFGTTLAKSLNTPIIWNDGPSSERVKPNGKDAQSVSVAPPFSKQQPQQSSPAKQKKKRSSSPKSSPTPSTLLSPQVAAPQHQHVITRINTRTMLMIAGLLLILSQVLLARQFYRVTYLITTHQLQQQRTVSSLQQRQDVSWISHELEKAAKAAKLWEKEASQQKRRLTNMIPS